MKEAPVNHLSPDLMNDMYRQRVKEELESIRLEREALNRLVLLAERLAALGRWMVAYGEKLRKRHTKQRAGYSELTKKVA